MFETPFAMVGNIVNDPVHRRVGDQELIKFRVASNSRRRTADGEWEAGNSLFVTFDLTPSGNGTLLKMTESGFREMGWEAAVLEQQYQEHVTGWDFYLARLAPYVATLDMRS